MKSSLLQIKILIIAFCAVIMLVIPGMAAAADPNETQDERLANQEQRIQKLEKRIQEMENAAMSGTAPVAEPKNAYHPETRESQQLMTGDELTLKEFPGSWPMFGSDMRMKIGGYIKTDLVFDLDGTTDKTQFLMSTIPVEGTPEHANDGYTAFFAKETRFNIDVRRVTQGAPPLRAFIEGDFFSAGTQFRLRHDFDCDTLT